MNTDGTDFYSYDDQFRDSIATVDEKGKRIWVYPKKPTGNLHKWRIIVTVVLLALLFGGPFLTINGKPFLLLNFFERKFVILGQPFWPQDFVLLAIVLITFFVFITLFTVVFGGYGVGGYVPKRYLWKWFFERSNTGLKEMPRPQRKLDKQPWNATKRSSEFRSIRSLSRSPC
jgi:polyferredoxin